MWRRAGTGARLNTRRGRRRPPDHEETAAQTAPHEASEDTRRDAILEAAGFATQRLVGAVYWRDVIPDMLARLGEAAEASRVHVFENMHGGGGLLVASERFEWTAPDVAPVIDRPKRQGGSWGEHGPGSWTESLRAGESLVGGTDDLVGEAGLPVEPDVVSMAVVPLFAGEEWWGTIVFDDCAGRQPWTQPEVDAFRTAAATLGASIERERAHDRLAGSLHLALVEQIPALTYLDLMDGGDRSVYVSPQIRTMLGYEPEDWLADDEFWRKHLHPDDAEEVWAEWRRRMDAGEPFSAEYRMVCRDGTTTWVSEQASVVPDEHGGPPMMQGVIMDISERKRDQDLLRKAETKYRGLVENVPVLLYQEELVPNPERFYISPQVTSLLGYTPEEWKGGGGPAFWTEHIHPDDRERVLAANAEADSTHNHYVTEYRFRAKDGRWVWLHDEAALIRDEDGRPTHWQGCMIDVTERVNAETALTQAEHRLRTLVEHIPAVTYVQAHNGDESSFYISPQVEATFGYPPNVWADPTFWVAHVHPSDRGWVDLEDRRTDETGDPVEMEYRFLAADGRYRWVRDEAVLLFDKEGNPTFWQGFLIDITERKHAEEALEHALSVEREAGRKLRAVDEMKTTFLRAVSHDLRTPLAAILGLAVTLGDENIELHEGESRELAGRIERNARKLERLVTDLLDLDRLSRGNVEPARQLVEIAGLLRSVVTESDLVPDHDVHVVAEPLELELDAAKVERILENLLANAARHTPPGTQVWVRAEPLDDGILICVDDAGPGVPEDERESIFEPFHQGTEAPAHSPGAGVGLALVTRFAQIHGGRAWVEDRDGGGASFRVFLRGSARPGSAPDGRHARAS